MQNTATHLLEIIEAALPKLKSLTQDEVCFKTAENKWSKIEILGHLIDSACNNQQKFVRMMQQSHLDFVGYDQNHWVKAQQYNNENWSNLLTFWQNYNLHIAHIIINVDTLYLNNTITINGQGPFTLEFIMKDYVDHLKHHLDSL